jgi:hypothetical protein
LLRSDLIAWSCNRHVANGATSNFRQFSMLGLRYELLSDLTASTLHPDVSSVR